MAHTHLTSGYPAPVRAFYRVVGGVGVAGSDRFSKVSRAEITIFGLPRATLPSSIVPSTATWLQRPEPIADERWMSFTQRTQCASLLATRSCIPSQTYKERVARARGHRGTPRSQGSQDLHPASPQRVLPLQYLAQMQPDATRRTAALPLPSVFTV